MDVFFSAMFALCVSNPTIPLEWFPAPVQVPCAQMRAILYPAPTEGDGQGFTIIVP